MYICKAYRSTALVHCTNAYCCNTGRLYIYKMLIFAESKNYTFKLNCPNHIWVGRAQISLSPIYIYVHTYVHTGIYWTFASASLFAFDIKIISNCQRKSIFAFNGILKIVYTFFIAANRFVYCWCTVFNSSKYTRARVCV